MNMTGKKQIKSVMISAVISGAVLAATVAGALENMGFEVPDKGNDGYEYAPAGGSWTFTPEKSGLAGPGSPWKCDSASPDPQGNQFAYLQYEATISQNMTGLVMGGTYGMSFYESYRTEMLPGNDLSVILDEGQPTELVIYTNPNVTNKTWVLRHTDSFVAEKSSYTLTFRSTHPLGTEDRTTIIDGVSLTLGSHPLGISFAAISNDEDCRISNFKSYTHALDFGTGTPGALINGVQFDAYNAAASGSLNFERKVSSGSLADHSGSAPPGVFGRLVDLMTDMYYNGNDLGGTTTWTLSGLTAGVTYDARIYVRQWGAADNRLSTFVFDPDGASPISDTTAPINEDNATTVGMATASTPYYINYRFTAVEGENLVIELTQHNSNLSWHLYGITCEKVEPTLKKLSPADDAVVVLPEANLVATFDVNVRKASGSITLKRSSDDSVVESYDVNSADVVVSGAQVTVKPTSDFESTTGYYVEIDAGAFEDDESRPCPALSGKDGWNFTKDMGRFDFVKITNDDDCGIQAFKTYTHKLDFGQGIPGAFINGVQFDAYGNGANTNLNFRRWVSSGIYDDHLGGTPLKVSGALTDLMHDMYYNPGYAPGGTTTWTLSGLIPGANYDTRIYVRQWQKPEFRSATLNFDPDGAGPISDSVGPINEDNATSAGMDAATDAYYISYQFKAVAGEDLVITATQHNPPHSWHLYGITAEVIHDKGTRIMIR